MVTERLMALTDGVVAVIITIMVLELKPPHGADLASLADLLPTFLSFVLSFVYVAIYWTNHHHFFKLVPHASPMVVWANFHLLFWLSLIPFATAWMDEHDRASIPVAVYGAVLMICAVSWYLLQLAIGQAQGAGSALRSALGRDLKGKLSPLGYLIGIGSAFIAPTLSYAIYALLAIAWLMPDHRVIREDPRNSLKAPSPNRCFTPETIPWLHSGEAAACQSESWLMFLNKVQLFSILPRH